MADSSSQEKTEDATPRRLREAREKGQVPKSRDLSQVFVFVVVFTSLALSMGAMGGVFKQYFKLCFDSIAQEQIDGSLLFDLGVAGVLTMAKILAPLFLAGMAVAFLTGFIQVGAIFSTDPLTPKPEKLNPIEGLKNMFKAVTFIELLKNIVKIGLVLYLAYTTIFKSLNNVLLSSSIPILEAAKLTGGMISEFIIKVSLCFIAISIFDYAIQRWNFMKNMRMSKDDVKREYKQDEGDPAIKGERRRLHREMAFGDVKQAVKRSDVVVTNPTHVAVALEYSKEEMGAPLIATKGQHAFAEMILAIAREEGIPIIRNIPLAWSLVHLEEGDEIPEELYDTVAEVLALVYEMKHQGDAPANAIVP